MGCNSMVAIRFVFICLILCKNIYLSYTLFNTISALFSIINKIVKV